MCVCSDAVIVFPDISLQLQNGMSDSQLSRGFELYTQLPKRPFLVDGVSEELVPVMSLTTTFRFAYIRRLHAQALEFPLDVSLAFLLRQCDTIVVSVAVRNSRARILLKTTQILNILTQKYATHEQGT